MHDPLGDRTTRFRPRDLFRQGVVLVCLAATWGCSDAGIGPAGGGEGPGHRAQRLALTPQQEYSLGQQAYREVLAKGRPLPTGDPRVRRVREIGARIAKAAENEPLQREINLHLKDYIFGWEFNVLQDPQVNAFCLPGGKVAVFTGLLKVVEDNDDALATVMSHEIAHALAHHSSERMAFQQFESQAQEAAGGGGLDRLGADDRGRLIGILAAGAAKLQGLSYERQQESEADHIGLFLMAFAGYDPEAAVPFWQKMREISAQRGAPPEILSDHPSDSRRIVQIQAWAPQAKGAYEAFREGRIAPVAAGR